MKWLFSLVFCKTLRWHSFGWDLHTDPVTLSIWRRCQYCDREVFIG